jgi:hypothetical protein
MKFNSLLLLCLFGAFLFVSCGNLLKKEEKLDEAELVSVKINDEYSVKIPDYMKKAESLNDEASLQYQNVFKETYVIVIDEPKQEFVDTFEQLGEYDSTKSPIENYQIVQMKNLVEGIDISKQTDPKNFKIHGLNAIHIQIDGSVEDVNDEIAYFLTFIEGKEKCYMMMAWTLKSRKEKYSNTFDTIAKSFRQLGGGAAD